MGFKKEENQKISELANRWLKNSQQLIKQHKNKHRASLMLGKGCLMAKKVSMF
ncbi:hypothetical protein PCIT_a2991 [Pseudoalteromonas citrea]|uniref:Uncharacterized protein n=1 Tax=Pseudoalteromonas citrea TaxID=43655 RepID=A0AAD4AHX9_9GAMM|nr:hypothetical protein PCIT_a2991 [Pseudoalteromonas citrea]